GGGVHVELEGVGAGLQRLPHGEQRARRRLPCTALVGIVEDPSPHPRVVHARQRTPVGWAVVLDHLFLDAIAAMRSALESALLERHAAEEHLQADVLLGDLTWETSYSLPGEGLLPRVRVDVTLDWSTWSQTAYRSWVIGEPADEPPELMIELAVRLGRLRSQPDLATVLAVLPETGPMVGSDPLERSAPALEVQHDGNLDVIEAAIEVSYEGIYV